MVYPVVQEKLFMRNLETIVLFQGVFTRYTIMLCLGWWHASYGILSFSLYSAHSVSVLGQDFRPGVCVCIQAPSDNDYPVFASVMYVLVPDELKFLLISIYDTQSYSQHHNAYCVTKTSKYSVVCISELAIHDVFETYILSSGSYVVIRSCCHTEVFVWCFHCCVLHKWHINC